MTNKYFSSKGVVLFRKNYSEADRIITIYSDTYGKVRVIAKGVRKPKSRKRGHLEVFSLIKFAASKTRGVLPIITEVETINNFSGVRVDLRKASVAYFLVEVINGIAQEDEENKEIFRLITDVLNKLRDSNNLKTLREKFVSDILVAGGFWPRGKKTDNPDKLLEQVLEKNISSKRVGKLVLS